MTRLLSSPVVWFIIVSSWNVPTQSATTSIEFFSIFVPNLTTRLAAAILSAFDKAGVEIGSDDSFVQLCAANILHTIESVLVGVVLDKAETTGSLLESVEAHDQAFDLAALGEELVNLFLGGVEGSVEISMQPEVAIVHPYKFPT